jgi:Icc-related predicted phosphoesterase
MRILAFSDLHTSVDRARSIAERAPDVDLVLGAGDFATMHKGMDPVIKALGDITTPSAIVCGNGETPEELRDACRAWPGVHVLHGEGVPLAGEQIFGLGAAVPVTPFGGWSYDLTEAQAAQLLAGCPDGAILVSHSPPKGHCDRSSTGESLGSTAVRDCIEHTRPRLVVCGHIHDSWGEQSRAGDTLVVNAGPEGVILEI